MKIWFISDTHNKHSDLKIPENIDIVIHSGDATSHSTLQEFESFFQWFGNLPIKHKIYVPGNHDYDLETFSQHTRMISLFLKMKLLGIQILNNKELIVDDLRIVGCVDLSILNKDQEQIDILITHYPPQSILDCVPAYSKFNSGPEDIYLGSESLLKKVLEIKPRYHVFGHIHECGCLLEEYEDINFINAAVLDEYYKLIRNGMVLDIKPLLKPETKNE